MAFDTPTAVHIAAAAAASTSQTPAQVSAAAVKAAAAAATALSKALRQQNNERTAAYFAVAMLGFIAIFTVLHWAEVALNTRSTKNDGPVMRRLVSGARATRSIMIRKVPGFTTLGHAVLFVVYVAVNIVLSFQNMDWSAGTLNNWAKRMGWVTAANLALITFLSLKNTPLAFLTAQSHEKLNPLHQASGYTTIALMFIHAVTYLYAFSVSAQLPTILEVDNFMGAVAGLSMLIILIAVFLIRRLSYEIFYVMHVFFFMVIVAAVAVHRPSISLNTVWIPIFMAAIWSLDRIIRFSKIAFYSYSNNATIIPLPHGGIRLTLKRSTAIKSSAVPGTHVFLWIPKIRALETHPFTIVSVSPLEFVVAAKDGFTKDLLAYATANPGVTLRASMDGPYGAPPNFSIYDRVIFIAGGSGGSFAFAAAVEVLRKISTSNNEIKTIIEFIYVVREHDCISWFSRDIAELHASPHVKLTIHVTRAFDDSLPASSAASEKGMAISGTPTPTTDTAGTSNEKTVSMTDLEKASISSSAAVPPTMAVSSGRPDISRLIAAAVQSADTHERIMIATCGPRSLTAEARLAAAKSVRGKGAAVDFFAEEFGW